MKLSKLAEVCEAALEGDGDVEINDVATIESAGRDEICFVTNKQYLGRLEQSDPGAVLAAPGMSLPQGMHALRHDDPDLAFSKAVAALRAEPSRPAPGVHDNAVIGEDFNAGDGASIGPFTMIGADVKVGKNTIIYPNCYIGDGVTIGDDCVIYPNVSILERCIVGHRCTLFPGVVIGGDGFGYHFVAGKFVKAPQRGIVVIEDDVDIGSNTTVDRARFDVTRIGAGTKIDNLCQIAHNVDIGQNCVMAALAGISGSVVIKDYVQMGGGVGISDHVTIGMGAKLGARSGVIKDVQPGLKMAGQPADEGRNFLRREAAVRKLPDLIAKVRELETLVNELKNRLPQ